MLADDVVGDPEAQAGADALRLGGEEGVEDLAADGLGDAASGVGDDVLELVGLGAQPGKGARNRFDRVGKGSSSSSPQIGFRHLFLAKRTQRSPPTVAVREDHRHYRERRRSWSAARVKISGRWSLVGVGATRWGHATRLDKLSAKK